MRLTALRDWLYAIAKLSDEFDCYKMVILYWDYYRTGSGLGDGGGVGTDAGVGTGDGVGTSAGVGVGAELSIDWTCIEYDTLILSVDIRFKKILAG